MLFTSYKFLFFALAVALLYYVLPKKLQNPVLLAASIFFYWYAMPKFLPLLLATGAVCYISGRILEKKSFRGRTAVFVLSLLLLLAPLFIYKYLGFFSSMAASLLGIGGRTLSLALPLGISFYTFQAVGYIIDCHNGSARPERNIVTLLLFISFFPQLMSGPIGRAKVLLPQYREERAFSLGNLTEAGVRFLSGLFKKVAIADNLGRFVDLYYSSPGSWAIMPITVIVVVLYALQIYFDFAGYSDMAIAAGRLFGIKLPENFNTPYLSASYRDFWNRWHMSLTSWFRDYLYIPLGGNRKGTFRKWINVLIVFLVSGLWHGAATIFVIWGLIQGVLRVLDELLIKKEAIIPKSMGAHILRAIAVDLCWAFSLIFFRADSLTTAVEVINNCARMAPLGEMVQATLDFMVVGFGTGGDYMQFSVVMIVLSLALAIFLDVRMFRTPQSNSLRSVPAMALPEWVRVAVYSFMYIAVATIGQFGASNFIYFNF